MKAEWVSMWGDKPTPGGYSLTVTWSTCTGGRHPVLLLNLCVVCGASALWMCSASGWVVYAPLVRGVDPLCVSKVLYKLYWE